MDDARLLRQYVLENSQSAFAQLTRRYVGLVYSVSLREVENPQMAEDVTQAVFLLLARKAPALSRRDDLAGWLFHASRLTAKNVLKRETRRVQHEQEVVQHASLLKAERADAESTWADIEPVLNEALTRLAPKEREAILMRFFANMTLKETGAVLGLTEDAARMRVARGVERLRRHLAGRGAAISASLLGTILATEAFRPAPADCLSAVSKLMPEASTGASVVSPLGHETSQLMEGVWKTMWIKKIKMATALTAAGLAVGGTTGGIIRVMADSRAAVSFPEAKESQGVSIFRGHPVVVVDAGHGGPDSGGVGAGGLTEKSVNLEIASRLREELIRRGATVYVTRGTDSLPSQSDHAAVADRKRADFFLSIHCDGGWVAPLKPTPKAEELETEVFYHAQEGAGRRLAQGIVKGVGSRLLTPVASDTTIFPNHGFGVLNHQNRPAVLIECGRIRDLSDGTRLSDPKQQQRLASGITDGLISFQRF